MLVIREIQSGKLKEFNEALKENLRQGRRGSGMDWGKGLAVSFTSLYETKQGLLLCRCTYYAESYEEQTMRHICAQFKTNEHMKTIRTPKNKAPNERNEYKLDKEQLSTAEYSTFRTLASISQPKESLW